MAPNLQSPITYLITSGVTTAESNPVSKDFQDILTLVSTAVKAGISLIQLREKKLSAKALYELTVSCAKLTRHTGTALLVNDRADVARTARADGVHLTTRSVGASAIRRSFGPDFVIGVSTHTLAEALAARDNGADFAVFGPVFDTPSKIGLASPVGIDELANVARQVAPFPIIALGGVNRENAAAVLQTDARGIAAIRLFADPTTIESTVAMIRQMEGAR